MRPSLLKIILVIVVKCYLFFFFFISQEFSNNCVYSCSLGKVFLSTQVYISYLAIKSKWCKRGSNALSTKPRQIYRPRFISEQNSKVNISLFSFKGKQRAFKPPHSSRVALKWLPCKILYL